MLLKDLCSTVWRNLKAVSHKLRTQTKTCLFGENRGQTFETSLFRKQSSGATPQGIKNVLIALGKNLNTDYDIFNN